MSPLAALGTVVISAVAIALAVFIVRFNRKRLLIARCAAAATSDQLERIYTLVERTGAVAANGYVLARTNRSTRESRCLMPVPKDLSEFPWAGKVIEATASREVQFQFVDEAAVEPSFLGRVYRPVLVPRHQTKGAAKERNTFSPAKYVAKSPELREVLETVCGKYSVELLSYLLCVGRASFEFEPIDQARIGTSPAWVQDPEYQTCDQCNKRMCLVLQLPGTVFSELAFHRGTFYLFGCLTHPGQTKTLGQFT
jgi:hypothetical protein